MFDKKKTMQQTEAAMRWIEKAGFDGDLSDLSAGIYDITQSVDDELDKLLPSLLEIDTADNKSALGFFIDLTIEMKHIEDHAKDAVANLIKVQDFFNMKLKSNKPTT